MKEAEALCEKIVFIKDGIIKAFGLPQGLKEQLRLGDKITIFFDGAVSAPSFKEIAGIYNLEIGDGQCRVIVDDHRKRLPQILDLFVRMGIRIINLSIQESDLEDVFITLVR
jgi:ABC-type multidrug transport system ATPase subunit